MKKIQFDYDKFTEWFEEVSEAIADFKTKEYIGEGGYCCDYLEEGNIMHRYNLWFGEAPPEGKSSVLIKGEIIEV